MDIVILRENLIDLINFVYPNLEQNSGNMNYLVGKAILTSKNINVKEISDIVMDRLSSDPYTYINMDSVDLSEGQFQLYSPEFLRLLQISELPSSELKLKVGVSIILL